MKKHWIKYGALILTAVLGFLAACPQSAPSLREFSTAPELSTYPSVGSISYVFSDSNPEADSYDVYSRQGTYSSADDVKKGTRISGASSGGTIAGLDNGQTYSVVVTALKAGYTDKDSAVSQAMPNLASFKAAPVLTLDASGTRINYTWTPANPAAESYTVYYRQGTYSSADDVKTGGVKISGAVSGGTINGLNSGQTYSVVVTASRKYYSDKDSGVMQAMPNLFSFTSAPALTLSAAANSISYTWTPSNPTADSYDLYYREGNFSDAAAIKSGTKISGAASGGTINGLINDRVYSVLVTANKADYSAINSVIRQAAPFTLAFKPGPVLTLSAAADSISYTWTAANPTPDSYDLFWRQGYYSSASDVKAGTKVSGAVSGGTINGLDSRKTYSVVVTANKTEYPPGDSDVKRVVIPSTEGGPDKSLKRGVGYGFDGAYAGTAEIDMFMLAPGVTWFYNWANTLNSTIENLATDNNVIFVPMVWNSDYNVTAIKNYLARHPEIEYILTYNEPMFTNEANMTPEQAAADWPRVKQLAADCNLKIIGPALNYGQMMGPKEWFQQFISQPGVSLSDMHAIALHCYMNYPSAIKWYAVEEFAEFGLPFWMTEFCAWEGDYWGGGSGINAEWQEKYMSEIIIYFEQDPRVERYAWFMPRSSWAGTNNTGAPFHALLQGSGSSVGLSRLGTIYINMSTCDKSYWAPAATVIPAAQFTANHLVEWTTQNGWPGSSYGSFPSTGSSVHFRPSTDTDPDKQELDVYNFTANNWQEYQVSLTEARTYTLKLRYQTTSSTNMSITVDGGSAKTTTLNSGAWATADVDLGNLTAGNRTIRLRVTGGNCALNWLTVE